MTIDYSKPVKTLEDVIAHLEASPDPVVHYGFLLIVSREVKKLRDKPDLTWPEVREYLDAYLQDRELPTDEHHAEQMLMGFWQWLRDKGKI